VLGQSITLNESNTKAVQGQDTASAFQLSVGERHFNRAEADFPVFTNEIQGLSYDFCHGVKSLRVRFLQGIMVSAHTASGVRTHAGMHLPELESGPLDHSVIAATNGSV